MGIRNSKIGPGNNNVGPPGVSPSRSTASTDIISVQSTGCLKNSIITQKGRRAQICKMLMLILVPLAILLAETIYILYTSVRAADLKGQVKQRLLASIDSGTIVHYLQIERGTTVLYIGSNLDAHIFEKLQKARTATDSALNSLQTWPDVTDGIEAQYHSKEAFHKYIQEFRIRPLANETDEMKPIRFYTPCIETFLSMVAKSVLRSSELNQWPTLVAFHKLATGKEQAGLERALGGFFYASGGFSHDRLLFFLEKHSVGKFYLESAMEYAVTIREQLNLFYFNTTLHEELTSMREQILLNNATTRMVQMGEWWFGNMTKYINILKVIQDSLVNNLVKSMDEEVQTSTVNVTVMITVLLSISVISPAVVYLIVTITKNTHDIAQVLNRRGKELTKQKRRADFLLNQILPGSVAERLRNGKKVLPEAFDSVTIFFSDIMGFTEMCADCTPIEVIDILNNLYVAFDETVDGYDAYKVETIGDSYMLASGVPIRNGNNHVSEIAFLAFSILDSVDNLTIPGKPDQHYKIRIGINTGPVVAGVVGVKMPRYCLFGDTVNTASRMESTGVAQRIHISQSTYECLRHTGKFYMEERGLINVKGKGVMNTYWLVRQLASREPKKVNSVSINWSEALS